jgi:hypothetical protein
MVGTVAEIDLGQHFPGFVHALGVVGLDARAGRLESRDDVKRRRIAHVVGVGFEGEPEHADGLALHAAAHRFDHPLGHGFLAGGVYRDNCVDDLYRAAMVAGRLGQG